MPRGRAIADVPAALYAATDRVLAERGPDGVSSRAVTDEAGVAKGVLHNHFQDLDGFLTRYAVDRVTAAVTRTEALLSGSDAGGRGAVDEVTDAAADLFGPGALAVSALLVARPPLLARVRAQLGDGGTGLDRLERALAAYLDAERVAGRLAAGADTRMLAFHLVASVHHLFYAAGQHPLRRADVRRVVASLLGPWSPGGSGPA